MAKKRPKSKVAKQPSAQTNSVEIHSSGSIDDDMIAAAISTRPQTVLMKVCRLCETKDGPFLNIFDADKVTAKKIEEVMPFGIAENDDLPHKICFRCSAKVEELYEFIQKCIKTQENLQTAVGRTGPVILKTKTRALWEEKLNKTNLSNEDICNAMIKKAMEGIKDIPLNPLPQEEKPQPTVSKKTKGNLESSKKDKEFVSSKNSIGFQSDDEQDEINLKQVKLSIEKCDEKVPTTRSSRQNKSEPLVEGLVEPPKKTTRSSKSDVKPENEPSKKNKQHSSRKGQNKVEPAPDKVNDVKESENLNNSSAGSEDKNKDVPQKVEETPPPINIMDHVSTIKVNGVGTLFLCKLCNRNFLKKDVVLTHGCARNNVPKDSFLQNHVPRPEIPKPPTVKYIKMDKDFNKTIVENKPVENKPVENKPVENKPVENKPAEKKPAPSAGVKVNIPVQTQAKLKPKVGPASKVKASTTVAKEPTPVIPALPNIPQNDKPALPSVQFPGIPSLNSRYKLVPGPNNTFTLVEESAAQNEEVPAQETPPAPPPQTKNKKKKSPVNNEPELSRPLRSRAERESSPEVIELDDNNPPEPLAIDRPYPVGLFQTVPHHSGVFPPNTHPTPPPFTTPAMKKQSYTIVQTGNPSKLLISTKPQAAVEEPPRKKSKKSKLESKETEKEQFAVPVEEAAAPKDAGFFTFINVDPLLQPSYVLPTDNIIQESQISTSTPASKAVLENKDKDKYSCNMCGDKFSREKKLLTHIQSHYDQMDEEDQLRAEKTASKRKTRKS